MDKPSKPSKEFPLFAHACGSWAKKIRGKLHYFGPWADPDAALAKYDKQRDDLQAGRTPAAEGGITLVDLCDEFLDHKRTRVDSGEVTERTWSEYKTTVLRILRVMGRQTPVESLRPADFDRLRADITKTRKAWALSSEVRRSRTIFKYAVDAEHVTGVRMGKHFVGASRKAMRLRRSEMPRKMIAPETLRAIIKAADVHARAMILLGLNCAFGQMDLATLPKSAVDLQAGWIRFPRQKTGIERECPLWPQTIKALREADDKRYKPRHASDTLFFVSRKGFPLVRFKPVKGGRIDAVGQAFRKLLIAANAKEAGVSFYALRHIFRTVADETKDPPAVRRIMGHSDDDKSDQMRGAYVESIDPKRLVAVVTHVRKWLFGR